MAGFFLVAQAIRYADARADEIQPQTVEDQIYHQLSPVDGGDSWRSAPIRASYLISIPYGFDTPLPVLHSGRKVIVGGHGGCTADQQVTIAVTVTQMTSGAVATGEKVQACTGELQTWSTVATAKTTPSFAAGTAEACGFATTRDGESVTDTFEWCKDVDLIELEERLYLPLIGKPGQ